MMVPRKPTRAIGYGRVSRVAGRATGSFQSPEEQRQAVAKWCDDNGVELIDHLHEDDESGGTINRPEFKRALARIEAGEADALVVAKLDRFARSIPRAYEAIERLERANAAFVSVADGFDLSTSQGRLMFNIMGSFAQFELDRHREQWRGAKANAIMVRETAIGPTPPGYRRAGERNGRPHGKFVRDPETAPHVTRAFELAGSKGLKAAAAHLAEHIQTKTFTAQSQKTADKYGVQIGEQVTVPATWNTSTVRRLVRSRVYRGEAYYRYKDHAPDCAGNGSCDCAYGDEEVVNPKAHEALVDEATFALAQVAADDTRVVRAKQAFPLSGIAECAGCGNPIIGSNAGAHVRTYRCSSVGRKGASCSARAMIKAEPLERWTALAVAKRAAERAAEGAVPVDTGALARALEDAETDLTAWAAMRRAKRAEIGEQAYGAGLETRRQERDEAAAIYREAIDNALPPEPHEVFGEVMHLAGSRVSVEGMEGHEDEIELGPDLDGLRGVFERGVRSMTVAKGRGSTPARLNERVVLELR